VILRHLSINGAGNTGTVGTRKGVNGNHYVSAAQVLIEDCQIFNFATTGINVNLTANGALTVERTTIDSNQKGVVQLISNGILNSTFDNCVFKNNAGNALEINAGTVNVTNSLVTNNGGGLIAQGALGSVLNANNNEVVNNTGVGIHALNAQATVRVNNNDVHRNGTGLSNAGVMQTCSNNKVYGNTTDVTGVVVPIPAPGSCNH